MAFDDHVTAVQADVVFNAVTGKASAEIAQLREEYVRTIGQMDDKALRASIAQDKLAKALSRNSVESTQVKRATLAYREEMARLEAQAHGTTAALAGEERMLGRFSRGAVIGTGALGRFARTAAFASSSLLGGFGLTYAIRSTVKASEEQQVALGHIQVALRNTGGSWGRYGQQIQSALGAQMKATGFTDNELADSLAGFIRRYGDVNQALKANAIAADVARAKNISLADAQTLVLRAGFGNPRSLRILGIELQKTTANYDALVAVNQHATKAEKDTAKAADLQASELSALDAVQRKYHGNAARYLQTTAGKQALFNAELDLSKQIIGGAILPALNQLLGSLTRYLEKANRTGSLQRQVNSALRTTVSVLHLLKAILDPLVALMRAFSSAVGGTNHAVEILGGALIAFKLKALAAKLEVSALRASLLSMNGLVITATILILERHKIINAIKHDINDSVAGGPGDLLPVKRGNNWVDPISGKIVQRGGSNPAFPTRYYTGAGSINRYAGFRGNGADVNGGTSGRGGLAGAKFTDVIPASLELAVSRAQLAGDKAAERAALRAEQAFLERELGLARTDQQRVDITSQLLGVKQNIESLTKAPRHRAPVTSAGRLIPIGLQEAVANARGPRQEIAAYRAERRYISQRIASGRLTDRQRLALEEKAKSIDATLKRLLKVTEQNAHLFDKQAQAFLQDLSGVIKQYAPNIHQTFQYGQPPEDPHAAAKHHRRAAKAAFA